MLPRLRLDIGWLDLLSALLPPRRSAIEMEQAIGAHAPPESSVVVGLSVRTLYDALLAETGNAPVVMSAVTFRCTPLLARRSTSGTALSRLVLVTGIFT